MNRQIAVSMLLLIVLSGCSKEDTTSEIKAGNTIREKRGRLLDLPEEFYGINYRTITMVKIYTSLVKMHADYTIYDGEGNILSKFIYGPYQHNRFVHLIESTSYIGKGLEEDEIKRVRYIFFPHYGGYYRIEIELNSTAFERIYNELIGMFGHDNARIIIPRGGARTVSFANKKTGKTTKGIRYINLSESYLVYGKNDPSKCYLTIQTYDPEYPTP